jgi:hypothetical protein
MKIPILLILTALCMPVLAMGVSIEKIKAEKMQTSSQLMPVIDGLLSAVREGNIEKAYQDYTAEDFRKVTSLDQFRQFISKYKVLAKNKTFQFHSLYFEDHIGTFQGALVSVEGEELQTEFDLVLENGKWKILGVQLFKPESAVLRQEHN